MSEIGVHESCVCGSEIQLHTDYEKGIFLQLAAWRENHRACLERVRPPETGDVRVLEDVDDVLNAMSQGHPERLPRDVVRAVTAVSKFAHASNELANRFRGTPISMDEVFQAWLVSFDGLPR